MYTKYMEITATNFRKNLFQILDQAARGESIEIAHKGAKLRLVAPVGSKLSRAVRRRTLLVDPASIVESDRELMSTIAEGWDRDDRAL